MGAGPIKTNVQDQVAEVDGDVAGDTRDQRDDDDVRRVVLLGPGGAGKSTLAAELGRRLDLPVIELDKEFWSRDLQPMPMDEWRRHQETLAERPEWVMDGDLGPYDDLEPRLDVLTPSSCWISRDGVVLGAPSGAHGNVWTIGGGCGCGDITVVRCCSRTSIATGLAWWSPSSATPGR